MQRQNIKKVLASFLRAVAATAPFTGGIAQLWSDYDDHKREEKFHALEEQFVTFLETPNDAQLRRSLIQTIRQARPLSTDRDKTGRWASLLKEICIAEIPKQLRSIRVDTKSVADFAAKRLTTNPLFEKRLQPGTYKTTFESDINSFIDSSSSISMSLGVSQGISDPDKYLRDAKEALTVCFPPIMLGVSAIFFFLRDIRQYNLNLRFDFAHSVELAHCLKSGGFSSHACVLGDAPALEIINKRTRPTYHFAMFMPRGEQRIVTPTLPWYRIKKLLPLQGTFTFINNELSTTHFQYQQLELRGLLNRKTSPVETREPHESIRLLRSGDVDRRLLLWTPFWQIYQKLDVAHVPAVNSENEYWYDALLFLQHSLHRYQKRKAVALVVAIREAWQELRYPGILEVTVDRMLEDPDYSIFLTRYLGLSDIL